MGTSVKTTECVALKKAVQSMKRGESSRFTINPEFLTEVEEHGLEKFFENTAWDKTQPFVMDITLKSLIKVESWYTDNSTMMRTLRKGKGRSPYTDSTIYFRIKIDVNDKQIFSNYPEVDGLPLEKQEDFK